jgi:hypothetical protein
VPTGSTVGVYLKGLFKKPVCGPETLELLDPFPELRGLGDLPAPLEIRTAVRRTRCSAGGVDGLRPEHLKSVSRDNDLFHSHVVKRAHEFWEGEEDGSFRVPVDWEICDTAALLLVSPVGGPHSLRGVGRGDGGGRGQWRREKNAQVPPVVEAKRGGDRGGSGVDSSPRPAVAFIGASTRHAKNAFETPPPILF